MRRRKEGLGYWLRHEPETKRASLPLWLKRKLRFHLSRPEIEIAILGSDVALEEPRVSVPFEVWDHGPQVIDELEDLIISRGDSPPENDDASTACSDLPRILNLGLCNQTAASEIRVAFDLPLAVHQQQSLLRTRVRAVMPHPTNGGIKSLNVSLSAHPVQTGQYWMFKRPIPVRVGTHKISKRPHVRWSVGLDPLSTRQADDFLREAEKLRGIKQGNGMLLALFHRVPIELVADYRYIREKQLLLYTLAIDDKKHARVHDLAAVTDKTTGQTFLIAHPSRYRTAILN